MYKLTYAQAILASLTSDQFQAINDHIARYGAGAHADAVAAAAPYGLAEPTFGYFPSSLTDEAKLEMMVATKAMVLASISKEMTKDDFAGLLVSAIGLSSTQAQRLVERNVDFEDYDASAFLRAMAANFPSVTGGAVSEILGTVGNMLDSVIPDTMQVSQDASLRRWRVMGRLLMQASDDQALTTAVLKRKTDTPDASDASVLSNIAEVLMTIALGAIPFGLGRLGRVTRVLGGRTRLLRPGTGDFDEQGFFHDETGDVWQFVADDSQMVVVPEAGDILAHPAADWAELGDMSLRREAGEALDDVARLWDEYRTAGMERGGFFSKLGKIVAPVLGKVGAVAGTALGSLGGPLGAAAGGYLGNKLGELAGGALAPKRAPNSQQASRPLVKAVGQANADIVDAVRAPRLVRGSAVDDVDDTARLMALFAKKGAKVTLSDLTSAVKAR